MSPARNRTGARSPRPPTIGWSRHRTGVTTTESGPAASSPATGCASRRSTATRCPTVSERGDRRSCGSVSQPGKQAMLLSGRNEPSNAVRSSASRAVAVTASTNRPSLAAMAAVRTARRAGGATRSTPSPGGPPGPAPGAAAPGAVSRPPVAKARCSRGSSATMLRIPARLMGPCCNGAVVTAWVVCGPAPGRRDNGGVHLTVLAARYSGMSPGMHETPALGRAGGSCCVTTPQVYVPAGPVCPWPSPETPRDASKLRVT